MKLKFSNRCVITFADYQLTNSMQVKCELKIQVTDNTEYGIEVSKYFD